MTMPPVYARVALETTLLAHGVPTGQGLALAQRLAATVSAQGAYPAVVGVLNGKPIVGMNDAQLTELLGQSPQHIAKVNSANLGIIMSRKQHGATTVSATMELAAGAGVRVFATGGLGGVHPLQDPSGRITLDISSDLIAFTRFPVAVVTSGVKSILDIASTREMLETLGVTVVGFQTDTFPAFYLRSPDQPGVGKVDARVDDIQELAVFVRHELARTGRGIVVCNPIPAESELALGDWQRWLQDAHHLVATRAHADSSDHRQVTPRLLAALHEVSGGATLKANIALVNDNARVAGLLARAMVPANR